MNITRSCCLCPLLLLLMTVADHSAAQENQVEDTQVEDAKAPAASPAASINDVAWIAGHWQGSAMGGEFEETWNPPFAGSMVGMFKFAEDQKVKFYEILTIVEKDGSLLLRLKHFDQALIGWEEKDKSVEFPLQSLTETKAEFDGLVFQKIDETTMHIVVTTKANAGETEEIKFVCNRRKHSQ